MQAVLKSALSNMISVNASDLHITSDMPLHYRIDEKLTPVNDKKLSSDDVKTMVYSLLSDLQIDKFEKELELDFSFSIEKVARFRVNVFRQRGKIGCAIRLIPIEIRNFEQCGLPEDTVKNFCSKPKGLVLVTGATGSGKSTSLAAMVDYINENKPCHIITVEDPIEFVHKNKKAIVDQREVFSDTTSFAQSLKHVLRQDPDVILIGELRDLETIESALVIAETGHLVFATLHTSDCVQTMNRVIDVFPGYQQQQIRTQLSFVLLGVLSQQLLPKAKGKGRALAVEVLVANHAVRSLVRESKIHQVYSAIQTSQREGMKTMNQALVELHAKGVITKEEAILRSIYPDEIKNLIH